MAGLFGFLLAPSGKPSVPRAFRWISAKDKRAFKDHLTRLSATSGLKSWVQ